MRSNNEPVRIRYKDLANGTKSIYLDTYKSGKRSYEFLKLYRRTRQTLWRAVQMLTQKLSCQTIHDCPKVVPLHYESEWQ